jgi:hypothetical protein
MENFITQTECELEVVQDIRKLSKGDFSVFEFKADIIYAANDILTAQKISIIDGVIGQEQINRIKRGAKIKALISRSEGTYFLHGILKS